MLSFFSCRVVFSFLKTENTIKNEGTVVVSIVSFFPLLSSRRKKKRVELEYK